MKLRGEANNEFPGTLSDLKETVKFYARGENYDTPDQADHAGPAADAHRS